MSEEQTSLDGKIGAFLREAWDRLRQPAFGYVDMLALIGLMSAQARHVPEWIIVPAVIVYVTTRRLW